jgi:hypothetical protein
MFPARPTTAEPDGEYGEDSAAGRATRLTWPQSPRKMQRRSRAGPTYIRGKSPQWLNGAKPHCWGCRDLAGIRRGMPAPCGRGSPPRSRHHGEASNELHATVFAEGPRPLRWGVIRRQTQPTVAFGPANAAPPWPWDDVGPKGPCVGELAVTLRLANLREAWLAPADNQPPYGTPQCQCAAAPAPRQGQGLEATSSSSSWL